MTNATNLESNVSNLHENYFFKEFTYSNNTFYNIQKQKVELADNIIYLDGLTIIFQLKERNLKDYTNQEDEQKWFERKVLGKANKQIKDTLDYLKENTQISLKNQQGDDFTLSESSITQIHKIIVYAASENLSDEYKYKKFHISQTAGVIHIFSIDVYREIIEFLMTPAEISEYFLFRETLIKKWEELIDNHLPEGALIGQYLSGKFDKEPSRDFIEYLSAIVHKIEDWDATGIIHSFRKRLTQFNQSINYYFIIHEIAKLRRNELKEFLKRYKLARENAYSGKYQLPYRFAIPRLSLGFIFIPWLKEDKLKSLVLSLYTEVHQYDQKLNKCIGVIFIEDDKESDEEKGWTIVEWCFLESQWEFNAELEKISKDAPFRIVSHKEINRYEFLDHMEA